MRLVMLSDTHGLHNQVSVPEGDILVHAGDWTMDGSWARLQAGTEWFNSLPHKHKIAIGGNHDWCLEHFMNSGREDLVREFFTPTHYLRDSEVTIEGLKFYGSPWQPRFFNWAFNADRGETIKKHWDKIPRDTDVLITHGPPYRALDYVPGDGNQGCADLERAVLEIKPKVHVFGHIHYSYGHSEYAGIQFFNASLLGESYKMDNKPWVYDL
jgi:predicted phosphodiesterase